MTGETRGVYYCRACRVAMNAWTDDARADASDEAREARMRASAPRRRESYSSLDAFDA